MPSLTEALRAMAFNNAWANHRLHAACAKLGQGAFEAGRAGFFPSIQATLNHNLTVDWFYVDALEGGALGMAAFAERLPCRTMAELAPAQAAVDRRLIAACESLNPARVVSVVRADRVQWERADRLLLHLFQHQVHHRGQAHAMLSDTSVAPPQLDEFFPAEEAPLRAAEFAALGWTEATVWYD